MSPTNNRSGIIYMLVGMFLYGAVDAQAKLLTESLHPFQVVWSRQLGLLLGVLVLLALRGGAVLKTAAPALQILRGSCAAVSAALFIFAVSYVPLADAVVVSFVAPFIVALLAAFLLGEPVGMKRWVAILIGFAATLIIMRPGMGVVHPALLLVLLAAAIFAVRQIISRLLSGVDSVETTIAYTALVSSTLLTLPLPFVWQTPQDASVLMLLVSMAALAAIAEVMVIQALQVAHAAVVAPIQYTLLLWGTLYGYLLFEQVPDAWTWFGALVIVVTGIYTFRLDIRRA